MSKVSRVSLWRLLAGVAGVAGVAGGASAQLTRLAIQTSLDGVSWSSATRSVAPGSTVQFRYVVSFDADGTTASPIGFSALNFQPTISGWTAGESLAPFATTGNNLNGGGVIDTAGGPFGRIIPFAATGPSTTDPYRAHTHTVGGVSYVRLARTTITNWIGVGATTGTAAANNTNGAGGLVCTQKGVNALNTSDPAFNTSLSNVVIAKFGMTLSGDTTARTLVFDAPLGGMSRNSTTGVREGSWYSSAADVVGTIKAAVVVTPTQLEVVTCDAPVVTTQPASIAACAGTTATLTVAATNATGFQWRKGGVSIPGATSATLSFPSILLADAGSYDCVVSNACTSVTSSAATLTVNSAPVITSQPASTSACVGSNASFTVVSSGASALQWRRNGVNIAGATSATLNLTGVTVANEGTYTCVLTNTCGFAVSDPVTLTTTNPPVIGTQPVSRTACSGESATFTVATSGSVSLQWRKDGVNIAGATSSTLSISPVVPGSAGSYDCVATNACGSVTSSVATLTVNVAPSITTQPANAAACPGSSASFTVAAAATPSPTFQWRRNGTPIAGAIGATLSLAAVVAGDAASYDCVVTNACGSVTSAAATLTLNVAPSITTQPANTTACVGSAASFTVAAGGTPSPTFQWRRNSTNIAGATSATLSLAAVAAGDAASYDCVVTNACGSVTSSAATLTVNVAPSITTQPANAVACTGSSASFTVAVSATPAPTFQWRRNASNIAGATSATLTLASVAAGDAASYSCVVTNACGSVTSSAATLTVNVAPSITTQPTSVAACPGSAASFTVAVGGTPSPTFQWRRNSTNIAGATSATLTIASVAAGDAASYSCVVTNACGSVTSAAATLTLNVAPSITTQPVSSVACAGSSASFTVVAGGTPSPTFQWRRNGSTIAGATSATLSLVAATAGDAGSYDCVVTNACGSATSSAATLDVRTPATITTQPATVSACTGQTATLTVVASGTGPLSYAWRKNGTAIAGATAASLSLVSLSASDSGSYDCVVTGPCNSVTSTAVAVNVGTAPSITTQPSNVDRCEGQAASLSVVATGTAPLTFQWKRNGVDVPGATTSTLSFSSLASSDAGSYTCVVTNGCSSATSSAATVAVRARVAFTLQPQSASVCGGSSVTFSVSATGAGPLAFQWKRDGVNIGGATSASLTLSSVTFAQAGTYACEVTGACGSLLSSAATLTVESSLAWSQQPSSVSAAVGQSVTLTAQASGAGVINYQWRKNGVNLLGATSSSLVFASLASSDSGTYVCVATGGCGTTTSNPAQVFAITASGVSDGRCSPVQLLDPNGSAGDLFGAVACSGDIIVAGAAGDTVGANALQGSASIFRRSSAGVTHEYHVIASDGVASDGFGNAVAAQGDTVVVAASNARVSGSNGRGAVYVFFRAGSTWTQQAKLVAADGAAGDAFGTSVAIDGDTILVGASGDDLAAADAGSAYVFTRSGTSWTQRQKLTASDLAAAASFGSAVAISGDDLIVGAPSALVGSVRTGAAYGFARSGNTWAQRVKFVDPAGAVDDRFGASVATEGGRFLVGAPGDNVGSNVDQGSVCSFVGWSGACVKIVDSFGAAGDSYGVAVAIRGDDFVVGMSRDDLSTSVTNSGAACVHTFSGSGGDAIQVARLVAPGAAAGDLAGESVAFHGDQIVMGVKSDDVGAAADRGSAWVFNRCPGSWSVYLAGDQQLVIDGVADGQGSSGDFAGSSVSVDGDLMAIGVPGDGVVGQVNRGSVRVLVRDQGQWAHRATLEAPASAAGDLFGAAVSVSRQRIAVGAPGRNAGQGAAFVYVASGSSFVLEQTFTDPAGAAGDGFGSVLSFGAGPGDDADSDGDGVEDDRVVIGAPGTDVGGNADQGAAHVSTRVGTSWSATSRLIDPAGAAGDRFGSSIASSTIPSANPAQSPLRVIAVGSPLDDGSAGIDQGSVVIFLGGEEWYFRQKLTATDAAAGDAFGSSVSLDGGKLAVGVPFDDVAGQIDQGSVAFFLGGEEWYFRQKLTSSTGAAGDRLGASVCVADDLLAAGSPGDDVGISADSGSIASFVRIGSSWVQQETLVATDVVSGAGLGSSISAAQDRVIGGAPGQSSASVAGIGGTWIFDAPLQCAARASNLTTGVCSSSLATSILSARTGDTLTSTPAAYAAASSVDTVGKSLALFSIGHIRTSVSSVFTLGGASSLMALDGAGVEINGRLLTSSGATGYVACDRFSLGAKGSLTARLNSSVMVDSAGAELLGAFRVESNGSALFTAPSVTSTGSMRVDQGGSLAFDGSLAFASTLVAATDSMISAQGAIDVHGTMSVTNAQISSSLLFNRDILELSGAVSIYGPTVNLVDMRVFGSSALFGDFTNELGARTTIRSGTLFLFGTLTNNGIILGTLCDNCTGLPPGMDVGGDLILGSQATLILPFQGSTLSLGGSFDCAIDSNERFDLSLATVQLEGRGAEQAFEAMSVDIGSLESGLDRGSPGQYPIGTLRIGPTPSVVRLVDARDNDGQGQESSCEAIYVDTLEILPGSRLINDGCIKIYYRTLILGGTVDNPDNLIVLAPPCFADFNQDGGVDFLDLDAFFASWETGDLSADVNLDGGIDGTDIDLFIAQWENGC